MLFLQLQLKTDFHDYYDHWFDREGQIFKRMSHSGISRREMFEFFEQIGLKTPPHGTPEQIFNTLSEQDKEVEELFQKQDMNFFHTVVYLDETAHRGEGKLLIPLTKAMRKYPNVFCSFYYPTLLVGSTSLRYLQIGDKIFWLRYTSDDWRSNYGNVNIEVLSQEKDGFHPKIDLPVFAIDFIRGHDFMWAIDFNIAPGIKGTGVEDILSAKEATAAIKRWYQKCTTAY